MHPIEPEHVVCDSERLQLRELVPEDAAFVLMLLNQPSWISSIGDRGVRTLDDARRYIDLRIARQYREQGYGLYALCLRDSARPIGLCGLVRRAGLEAPDLGFALLDEFAGQGYAREAAQSVLRWARAHLELPELLAITAPANGRSRRLLEALGFHLRAEDWLLEDEPLCLYALPLDVPSLASLSAVSQPG